MFLHIKMYRQMEDPVVLFFCFHLNHTEKRNKNDLDKIVMKASNKVRTNPHKCFLVAWGNLWESPFSVAFNRHHAGF